MPHRTKKVGVTLVVLFIILVLAAGVFMVTQQSAFPSGATFVSLSNVEFVSNEPGLSGKFWVIQASIDGRGESLVGTVKSTRLSDGTNVAKNSFTLSIDLKENKAVYRIESLDKFLYDYNVVVREVGIGRPGCPTIAQQAGMELSGEVNLPGIGVGNACVLKGKTADGRFGEVEPVGHFASVDVAVTVQGKTQTATVDTKSNQDVSLGSLGRVRYLGSLVAPDVLPVGKDICGFFTSGRQWKTSSCSDRNDWLIQQENLNDCVFRQGSDTSDMDKTLLQTKPHLARTKEIVEECISPLTTRKNSIIAGKTFRITGGQGEDSKIVESSSGSVPSFEGDESKGKITFDLGGTQFNYPQLRLSLSGDVEWLGVKVPVGKPSISCGNCIGADSGQEGSIVASVKNIGSSEGSFDVAADCDSPLDSFSTRRTNVLAPGETQKVYLPVTADTSRDITESCKVSAASSVKTEDKVFCNTECSFSAATQSCSEGTERAIVSENLIERCTDGAWEIKERCSSTERANPLTKKCESAEGGGEGGGGGEGDCNPTFSVARKAIIPNLSFACLGFVGSFKIVLAFLIGLLTFAVLGTAVPKFEDPKVKTGVLVGAVVAALLVGYLIYSFMLFGIVLAIVLFIFRGLIGGLITGGAAKK